MFKKLISLTLVMTMLLCNTLSFASNYPATTNYEMSTYDEQSLIQEVYNSLSDDAKELFNQQIAQDPKLIEIHEKYIGNLEPVIYDNNDTSYSLMTDYATARSEKNALDVLTYELSLLALSAPLYYALMAQGAALVAAGVDGPVIPIGDVVGVCIAGAGAVIIAIYYQEFMEKYSGISRAFSMAFVVAGHQIQQALNDLYQKCAEKLSSSSISISGQTVNANGEEYRCTTLASSLSERQKRLHKYYPALLYNGNVYVDTTKGMDTPIAKGIIAINDKRFGVWANSDSYARGACGNNAKYHEPHGGDEGYYQHYHSLTHTKSHCWFL